MATHDEKIDRHIEDAERWAERLETSEDPIDLFGWRPTVIVLAKEVKRLRLVIEKMKNPLRGKALLDEMDRVGKEICSSKESALAFMVEAGIYTPDGELTERYREEPEDERPVKHGNKLKRNAKGKKDCPGK